MELTQFYTWAILILCFVLSEIAASPTFGYDDPSYHSIERIDRGREYVLSYGHPLTPEHLSRLRRGYYYVNDGYIAAVPNDNIVSSVRRQDTAAVSGNDNQPNGVRFQPIVRYKETRTKRKKLFVPNLFG